MRAAQKGGEIKSWRATDSTGRFYKFRDAADSDGPAGPPPGMVYIQRVSTGSFLV
jgi:hypothetical protein